MASDYGEEIRYAFNAIFFDIRENLASIKFHFNRDLSDNILLRGLPLTTKRIMSGADCNGGCKKAKNQCKCKKSNE